MKRYLLSIILTSLFFVSVAQENTTISFSKVFYDFGNIKEQYGPVTYTFNFKNTGKKPFKITNVNTSCGCTSPAYSREPVKPGDSGFVKVTFDPKGKSGSFSSQVNIQGNLVNSVSTLTIIAWVEPRPLTIEDEYDNPVGNLWFKSKHVTLGEVYSTAVDTATISFYNGGSKPIKIQYLTGPIWIKHSKLPVNLLPKQKGEIEIYYSAYLKNELGFVRDQVKLYTDDNLMPEKELNIYANIKVNIGAMSPVERANAAKIDFDVFEHDFGMMKQGDQGIYEFKFTNTGKSTLVIYTIKTSCGCTATTLGNDKIAPGESSIIKVTYNSAKKLGQDETFVTIYTNDPDRETVRLSIKANVLVPAK